MVSQRSRWYAVARVAVVAIVVGLAPLGVDLTHTPLTPSEGAGRATPHPVAVLSDGTRVTGRMPYIVASAADTAAPGTRIKIEGQVRTSTHGGVVQRRQVVLHERVSRNRWRPESTHWSSRSGAFKFTPSAGTTTTERVFRLKVLRTPQLPAATSSTLRVDVAVPEPSTTGPTPTPNPTGDWDPAEYPAPDSPAPVGSSTDWTYLVTQGGRWNPCQTIRWMYNPAGGYDTGIVDMKRAFARIAGISGLHFKYTGETPYTYGVNNGQPSPDTDITVGWASAAEVPSLAGDVVGVGGAAGTWIEGRDVRYRLVSGFIVLDRESTLPSGHATSGFSDWGQVMTHEGLHALGLGHAVDPRQLMTGVASLENHRFGAGDTAGMAAIGATNGCL